MKLVSVIALVLLALACGGDPKTTSTSEPIAKTQSFVVPEGTEVDWTADCSWPVPENSYQFSGSWVTDGENIVHGATMDFTDPTQNCSFSVRTTDEWGLENQTQNCVAHATEVIPKTEGAAVETQQIPFTCQDGDTEVRGLGTETTSAFHVCQEQVVSITDLRLSPGQVGHISAMAQDPLTMTGFAVYTGFDDTGIPGILSNPNVSACGEDPGMCGTNGFFRWTVPYSLDYQCGTGGSFWMSIQVFDGTQDVAVQGCKDRTAQYFITCT